MSEDPGWYDPGPDTAERMRQSLARTLRQIADHIEAAPAEQIPDIMTLVTPAAGDLIRRASALFNRAFGEREQ